jgi:hypothetical protein
MTKAQAKKVKIGDLLCCNNSDCELYNKNTIYKVISIDEWGTGNRKYYLFRIFSYLAVTYRHFDVVPKTKLSKLLYD